jgi:hypothetical protein
MHSVSNCSIFNSKLARLFPGDSLFLVLFLSLAALAASSAQALPVGFKDSWMTMGEVSRDYREASLIYNFGQKTAVGFGGMGMKYRPTINGVATERRIEIAEVHLNHRLARWNLPEAQANIYVLGGIGAARGSFFNGTNTALLPGLQLDYETRRVYAALKWHGSYAQDFNFSRYGLSGGFSFYKTEYDEWQPWAVLEASRMGGDAKDAAEITPYLRFIHKTLFIEAGAPFKRGKSEGLKINFRYTF